MRTHKFQGWLAVGALLVLPVMAHAQEATLRGTVSDTTGGALPGVTVQAVHEASGNSFEAVTDERGAYFIPARVGAYALTAELAGFGPVTQTVTLLVGQEAVVDLEMTVGAVQESVTVTGEAPLLDVTQSSLSGNLDPRQLQELPVNGRNWLDLVMLAPGAQTNYIRKTPSQFGLANSRVAGDFQVNVDGQLITSLLASADKTMPRFSKDAIAEFEFVSGQFNATQGRSTGMQVNMITKSGTNIYSGSFAGYFRHDSLNAADLIAKRVLPYQDQQLSGIFGGPLRQDRVHFFANYEYEREPLTLLYTTSHPHFNRDLNLTHTEKLGGGRLDAQFSPQVRLSTRVNLWRNVQPSGGGGGSSPSSANEPSERSNQIYVTLTQVLNNRAVNEIKGGLAHQFRFTHPLLVNPNARFGFGGPRVALRGGSFGSGRYMPNDQGTDIYSIRDDLTLTFNKGGGHTLKLGGEYLHMSMRDNSLREATLDATLGPIPVPVEVIFPDLFDASTWNLDPLSPITRRWSQGFGPVGSDIPRYTTAVWVQDDWTVSPRLTLNLGLRYDLELNAFGNDIVLLPFLTGKQPNDFNNVGPRLGFSFSQNDRTVVRGGYGLYYGTVHASHFGKYNEQIINVSVLNDGRPDFASNPFNGPAPTFEELEANLCTTALVPGCVRREAPTTGTTFVTGFPIPYSHQASIGVQRQVGNLMAMEADYVYAGSRHHIRDMPANVTYDPATGVNLPASFSTRPYPEWDYVSLTVPGSRANRHALQTSLTKRFSAGWQASATYTLAALWDADPRPIQGVPTEGGILFAPVPFATPPDMGGEYTLAAGEQRHRAVFNGIWQAPGGFQLSGLYFFGSGQRYPTKYGPDLRKLGAIRPNDNRLRPDGTIVPRNDFVGTPIHRVDLRIQRRFPLGGQAGIDGILEIFNVFNHFNVGTYSGTRKSSASGEVSRNYLNPAQNRSLAYAARQLQIGFRITF